jgi:hypothetical protein
MAIDDFGWIGGRGQLNLDSIRAQGAKGFHAIWAG